MYKMHYDQMVESYSQQSKEELVQSILSKDEIACSDRAFANECFAGTAVASINELFRIIDELNVKFSYCKAAELERVAEKAKGSWNHIVCGLAEINKPNRDETNLKRFKERVEKAVNPSDSI